MVHNSSFFREKHVLTNRRQKFYRNSIINFLQQIEKILRFKILKKFQSKLLSPVSPEVLRLKLNIICQYVGGTNIHRYALHISFKYFFYFGYEPSSKDYFSTLTFCPVGQGCHRGYILADL